MNAPRIAKSALAVADALLIWQDVQESNLIGKFWRLACAPTHFLRLIVYYTTSRNPEARAYSTTGRRVRSSDDADHAATLGIAANATACSYVMPQLIAVPTMRRISATLRPVVLSAFSVAGVTRA